MAPRRIATVALLVRDYDEAIAWFTRALGFVLLEDSPREAGKRWVVVAPSAGHGAALLLARAADDEQRAQVGRFAGGRVGLFLETGDFARDHAAMTAHGVEFLEAPRDEAYGRVVKFLDLYGNRWDLLETRERPRP
jgi:catechol 2,3-dioxygenase-like lactoylglutathione lyase family enzyme